MPNLGDPVRLGHEDHEAGKERDSQVSACPLEMVTNTKGEKRRLPIMVVKLIVLFGAPS